MRTEVALFLGRFQPFTKAHSNIVTSADVPVVTVIVRGANDSRSPFSVELTEQIISDSLLGNSKCVVYKNGYTPDIISLVESTFNVTVKKILAGTDRIDDYKKQLGRAKISNVEVVEVSRTDEDISATKVREAILTDDFASYRAMMCNGAHRYFHTLQKILLDIKK